jgi:TRAP-type C4-dicarboxylate transport system substrate-binding protein
MFPVSRAWRIGTVVTWSLVVNKNRWDALPTDLKEAVSREFRAIEDDHFAAHETFSREKIGILINDGMTLFEAPQSELDKVFADDNVRAVYDNWYKLNEQSGTDGRALVKKIEKLKKDMM